MKLKLSLPNVFLQVRKYLPLVGIVSLASSAFFTAYFVLNYNKAQLRTQVKAGVSGGAPSFVRLSNLSGTHATISFFTPNGGDAVIYYGEQIDRLDLLSNEAASGLTYHSIDIANLKPSTQYYFKVCSNSVCDDSNPADLYGLVDITGDWGTSNIIALGSPLSFKTPESLSQNLDSLSPMYGQSSAGGIIFVDSASKGFLSDAVYSGENGWAVNTSDASLGVAQSSNKEVYIFKAGASPVDLSQGWLFSPRALTAKANLSEKGTVYNFSWDSGLDTGALPDEISASLLCRVRLSGELVSKSVPCKDGKAELFVKESIGGEGGSSWNLEAQTRFDNGFSAVVGNLDLPDTEMATQSAVPQEVLGASTAKNPLSKLVAVVKSIFNKVRATVLRSLPGKGAVSFSGYHKAIQTQNKAYDFNGDGKITEGDYPKLVEKVSKKTSGQTQSSIESGEEIATESLNLPSVSGFSSNLFTGTASVSYPISLPTASGGSAPSLAVSYSSGAVDDMWLGTETKWRNDPDHPYQKQAGELGLGWNLGVGGSILRDNSDTAWDLSDDRFMISFGGGSADLVPVSGAENYQAPYAEYKTSPDLFAKVVRYGIPNWTHWRYHWVVTDRNGTVSQFGSLPQSGWRQDFDPQEKDNDMPEWYRLDATRSWIYSTKNSPHISVENKWNLTNVKNVFGVETNYSWGMHKVGVDTPHCDVGNCDPDRCYTSSGSCRTPEECCNNNCADDPNVDCDESPKDCPGCNCQCIHEDYAASTFITEIVWGRRVGAAGKPDLPDTHKVTVVREPRLDKWVHLGDQSSDRTQQFSYPERVRKIVINTLNPQGQFRVRGAYTFDYDYVWNPAKHKDSQALGGNGNGIPDSESEIVAGQVIHSLLSKITQWSGDPDANSSAERMPSYSFSYDRLNCFVSVAGNEQALTDGDYFLVSASNGYGGRVEYSFEQNAIPVKMCDRNRGAATADGCLLDHSYNSQAHRVLGKTVWDGMGNYVTEGYDYNGVGYTLAAVEEYPFEQDTSCGGTECQYCQWDEGPCNCSDVPGLCWQAGMTGEYPCEDSYRRYYTNPGECYSFDAVECRCNSTQPSKPATDFENLGFPKVTTTVYEKNMPASAGNEIAKSATEFHQFIGSALGASHACFKPSPLKSLPKKSVSYNVDNSTVPHSTATGESAVRFSEGGSFRYVIVSGEDTAALDGECASFDPAKKVFFIESRQSFSQVNNASGAPALCAKTAVQDYDTYGNPALSVNYGEINCASKEDLDLNDNKVSFVNYTSYDPAVDLKHILPKPSETWVSNSAGGEKFSHSKVYYDNQPLGQVGEYGLPTRNEALVNGSVHSFGTVEYENNYPWNATTTVDTLGRRTSTVYDNFYHSYPVSVTNPKGQTASTVYDFDLGEGVLGLARRVTDPNGAVAETLYDVWGRGAQSYLPGRQAGSSIPNQENAYYYFNETEQPVCDLASHCMHGLGLNGVPKMLVASLSLVDDNGTAQGERGISHVFYNGLGQKVQSRSGWVSGDWSILGIPVAGEGKKDLVTATDYNALGAARYSTDSITVDSFFYNGGNNSYVSVDFAVAAKTENIYDGLGRPTATIYPDGTSEQIEYDSSNPLKTTFRDKNLVSGNPGSIKTTLKDVFGNTVRVEETMANSQDPSLPSGKKITTEYAYHPILGAVTDVFDTSGLQAVPKYSINHIQYNLLGQKTSMQDIDMANWSYDYDVLGNLVTQTDAKGQTITLEYDDPLNRLTAKKFGGKKLLEYGYDNSSVTNGIGRKTSFTTFDESQNAVQTVRYYYDKRGQLTKEQQIFGHSSSLDNLMKGKDFITEYSYDEGGRVSETSYPANSALGVTAETVISSYNGPYLNSLGSGAVAGAFVSEARYNKDGSTIGFTSGNGVSNAFFYNPLSRRLETLRVGNRTEKFLDNAYSYDNVGNITEIADLINDQNDPFSSDQLFAYDPLYRLKNAAGAYTAQYIYDDIGNIRSKLEGQAVPGASLVSLDYNTGAGSGFYHRPATGSVNGVSMAYSYDSNGNLLDDGTQSYTYDVENRLTAVTGYPKGFSCIYDNEDPTLPPECSATKDCVLEQDENCVADCSECAPVFTGYTCDHNNDQCSTQLDCAVGSGDDCVTNCSECLGYKTKEMIMNLGNQSIPGPSNTAWQTPPHGYDCSICKSDDTWAEVLLDNNYSLGLRGWGGTFNVPAGAVIKGIEVEVEGYRSPTANGEFSGVWLYDGSGFSDSLADCDHYGDCRDWPTSSDQTTVFGGPEETWGFDQQQLSQLVNSSNFGVVISAKAANGSSRFHVDYILMKAYFSVSGVAEELPAPPPSPQGITVVFEPGAGSLVWESGSAVDASIISRAVTEAGKQLGYLAVVAGDWVRVYVPGYGGDDFEIKEGDSVHYKSNEAETFDVPVKLEEGVLGASAVELAKFVYNGEGQRLAKKDVQEGKTTYYISPLVEVIVNDNGTTSWRKNYYFGGRLVSVREHNNE